MGMSTRIKKGLVICTGIVSMQLPMACADSQTALSSYKNCIESVVFELKKKTTETSGPVRINSSWTKQGDLIATLNTGGVDIDFGPDTPEQVLFKLEQRISPEISMLRDSLVYKMCGGGTK